MGSGRQPLRSLNLPTPLTTGTLRSITRPGLAIAALLTFLAWVCIRPATLHGAQANSNRQQQSLVTYQTAVRLRTTLEGKPQKERSKEDYLRVVQEFRSVFDTLPGSAKADDALKALGELYHLMATQLKTPEYLQQAIHYYSFLEKEYPWSPFCPEVIYAAAEIYLNDLNEPKVAQTLFARVLKRYPDALQARQARAQLSDLRERLRLPEASTLEALGQRRTRATPLQSADGLSAKSAGASDSGSTQVQHIRTWITPQATRILISTSRPARYSDGQLENPARIYLDVHNSRLSSDLTDKTAPPGGVLQQIRTGHLDSKTSRVVFDLKEMKNYRVFHLSDPFRIVVEIKNPVQTALPMDSTPLRQLPQIVSLTAPEPAKKGPEKIFSQSKPPKPPLVVPASTKRKGDQEVSGGVTSETGSGLAHPSVPGEAESAGRAAEPPPIPVPGSRKAKPNSDGRRSLIRTLGLKIGRIVIDPGHGGPDTGTIGPSGLMEKDLVLDVSVRLKELLEKKLGGEVVLTRYDDTFVPLEERTAIANDNQADLFISIHANSSHDREVSGVETFFLNFAASDDSAEVAARENASSQKTIFQLQDLVKRITLNEKVDESREFARTVQQTMAQELSKRKFEGGDRGVKQAPFIVLIGANMPSILSEVAFVSNPKEEKRLKSSTHRQKLAEALYLGIGKYVKSLSGVKTARNILGK